MIKGMTGRFRVYRSSVLGRSSLPIVQVTKYVRKISELEPWEMFLAGKGIYTEIRTEIDSDKLPWYSLWREITVAEQDDIDAGKLVIVGEYLTYKNIESMCVHRRSSEEMESIRRMER